MGIQTDIEWADSTLNLQMGCDGCELWNPKSGVNHCYAGTLTERYGGRKGWPESFDKPAVFAERLAPATRWADLTGKERPHKPWLNGLPRIIFLNDMGDTFTESLPLDWLAPMLPEIANSPHQWMILTKRASRLRQFSHQFPLPKNVWPGVSVTSQGTAKRAMVLFDIIGGGPRWLSVEPLLSEVRLDLVGEGGNTITPLNYLQLVIVGGESGPHARPCDINWIRSIRDQCKAAGVPCFIKQLGSRPILDCPLGEEGDGQYREDGSARYWTLGFIRDKKGGDPEEWPEDLRVRSFPAAQHEAPRTGREED
jgi:protein gp37